MLERLVILCEPEAACAARLRAQGCPGNVAAEIAFYLAQATDFVAVEASVRGALAAAGVELVTAALDDVDRWLPCLRDRQACRSLLWCLTDGFAFYRGSHASSVAALLDVPQFGSPPAAQHACQDKFRCSALAAAAGLPVPPALLVENGEPLSPAGSLPAGGPFFVKPNTLGAKLGIGADARAPDLGAALALSRSLWARYGDRAIVQPFLPGRDLRVSFMDTGPGSAPAVHAVYAGAAGAGEAAGPGFVTLAQSRAITGLRGEGEAAGTALRLEDITASEAGRRVAGLARGLARVAGLRDYWSMDFRLGADGTPWFLEFEVCPAVTIYDFLTYLRDHHGCDLPTAVARAAPLAHARRLGAGRWAEPLRT